MQRRTLLKLGLAGAAVLAVAGAGVAWLQAGVDHGRLTPAGRRVFEAVARAVLDGSLPAEPAERAAALAAHLDRLDALLATLPESTRQELSRLLGLLAMAPGRWALAGLVHDWSTASVGAVQKALSRMRTSPLQPRQLAYHALRDLTNAAYFADPAAWRTMGYPGPREL